MTNYVEQVAEKLRAELPQCDPHLIELYTLLALTKGQRTTAWDIHNAWAVRRNTTQPEHHDLVPYRQLSPEAIAKDQPFVAAVRRASQAEDQP